MEAWRNSDLDKHYLALFIDSLLIKLKRESKYKKKCFYIILGLKEDYTREIVAIVNSPYESAQGAPYLWRYKEKRFKNSFRWFNRNRFSYIRKIANTQHQRYIVHLQRKLSAFIRRKDKKELAENLRSITNQAIQKVKR